MDFISNKPVSADNPLFLFPMIRNDEEQYHFDHDWEISRKTFLRALFLGSIAISLPIISCEKKEEEIIFTNIDPLSQKQFRILRKIQAVLLPSSENAPGALDVNADNYFIWLINDPRMNQRDNDFLIDKLNTINDEVIHRTGYDIEELSDDEIYDFIQEFAKEGWRKRWTSRMLTILFEALLLDPVYNINTNEAGWKWLGFIPGSPRINKENKYPEIFEKIRENE